jgi:hypothetical protein
MRLTGLKALGAACATIAVAMLLSAYTISRQSGAGAMAAPVTQDYNPYPPGILPADLSSETARVQREVDLVREQKRWRRSVS